MAKCSNCEGVGVVPNRAFLEDGPLCGCGLPSQLQSGSCGTADCDPVCKVCAGLGSLAVQYKDCTWCDKPQPQAKCMRCSGTGKMRAYLGYKEEEARRKAVETHVFQALKNQLPELKTLLASIDRTYEDKMYRYYHHSAKVYQLQDCTNIMVLAFGRLAPEEVTLNSRFMAIVNEGTGKVFEMDHNHAWSEHTRPMVEAFLHAKYFLEQLVKYGEELDSAPSLLPSGWASCLYLFDIR